MRQDDSMVPVIQADRTAAAPYMGFAFRRALNGEYDEGTLVEAFARHRLQALESSPADGDGGAIRAAVIEECARVAEDQHADDWFEVGKVVVATGKRIAAAIRALTPTETGEVG